MQSHGTNFSRGCAVAFLYPSVQCDISQLYTLVHGNTREQKPRGWPKAESNSETLEVSGYSLTITIGCLLIIFLMMFPCIFLSLESSEAKTYLYCFFYSLFSLVVISAIYLFLMNGFDSFIKDQYAIMDRMALSEIGKRVRYYDEEKGSISVLIAIMSMGTTLIVTMIPANPLGVVFLKCFAILGCLEWYFLIFDLNNRFFGRMICYGKEKIKNEKNNSYKESEIDPCNNKSDKLDRLQKLIIVTYIILFILAILAVLRIDILCVFCSFLTWLFSLYMEVPSTCISFIAVFVFLIILHWGAQIKEEWNSFMNWIKHIITNIHFMNKDKTGIHFHIFDLTVSIQRENNSNSVHGK